MNPSVSGIHLVPYIQEAQKKGARLVVVDPRRTRLAESRRPAPGAPAGNGPARGAVRDPLALREGRADRAFLAAHATGAEELERRASPWTLERAAAECRRPGVRHRGASRGCTRTRARPRCAAAGGPSATATAARRSRRSSRCPRSPGSSACGAAATRCPTPAPGGRSTAWRPPAAPEPSTRAINMNRVGAALSRSGARARSTCSSSTTPTRS